MIPHIVTPAGLTFFYNGESYVVPTDHRNFDKVKEFIASPFPQAYDLKVLLDVSSELRKFLNGLVEIKGATVYVRGSAMPESVSEKVLRMIDTGAQPEPICRFLNKVLDNPSASAQRELLLFCEANGFAIHEDGDIIAFKGVRPDYKDCHTGTIDNSVGQYVSMPRGEVDDRRDVTCSFGLHFAALDYANHCGSRTVVVKVSPIDVVSIPNDYNNQKGRCCAYTVIGELPERKFYEVQEVYNDDSFSTDEDEEESSLLQYIPSDHVSDFVTRLRNEIMERAIVSEEEFASFVEEQGYDLSTDDVRGVLQDNGFANWL